MVLGTDWVYFELRNDMNCGQQADYGKMYFSLIVKANSAMPHVFFSLSDLYSFPINL